MDWLAARIQGLGNRPRGGSARRYLYRAPSSCHEKLDNKSCSRGPDSADRFIAQKQGRCGCRNPLSPLGRSTMMWSEPGLCADRSCPARQLRIRARRHRARCPGAASKRTDMSLRTVALCAWRGGADTTQTPDSESQVTCLWPHTESSGGGTAARRKQNVTCWACKAEQLNPAHRPPANDWNSPISEYCFNSSI